MVLSERAGGPGRPVAVGRWWTAGLLFVAVFVGLEGVGLKPSEAPVQVTSVPSEAAGSTELPVPPPTSAAVEKTTTTTTAARRADAWRALPSSPLRGFAAIGPVWTGKDLLVWGEVKDRTAPPFAGVPPFAGAAYDPAANRWRRIAPSTLPGSNAWRMSAVWTGSEVLVWGAVVTPPPDGYANTRQVQPAAVGGRYNPATNTWRAMSTSPLTSRFWHEAVWTGREMIVWGGASSSVEHHLDGAAYDPVTDRWRRIATGPFTTSVGKVAVWTGERLIMWGGCRRPDDAGEGGIYDPVTDRWQSMPAAPVVGRDLRSNRAHWTGREFLFWSGRGGSSADRCDGQYAGHLGDGAAYDPAARKWRRLPAPPAAPRLKEDPNVHVWTGNELLVFAAEWVQTGKGRAAGAAYNPATNAWRRTAGHSLVGRLWPEAVWTGTELILWGPRNLSGWGDVYPVAGDDAAAAYAP